MFCPNCGTQNADNVTFCANCGASLAGEQPVQQVSQQPVYQQPVYQQPTYQQSYRPAPASNPGKGLGIAGMVLGIVGLISYLSGWFSIVCCIIGLILSGIGMKKSSDAGAKNGMGIAGLVCSLIGLGLAAYWLYMVNSFVSALDSLF